MDDNAQRRLFAAIDPKSPTERAEFVNLLQALNDYLRMDDKSRMLVQYISVSPPKLVGNRIVISENISPLEGQLYGNIVILHVKDPESGVRAISEYKTLKDYCESVDYKDNNPRVETRNIIIREVVYKNGVINYAPPQQSQEKGKRKKQIHSYKHSSHIGRSHSDTTERIDH